jgi:hypothetical protein
MLGNSWVAAELAAPPEGLSSMSMYVCMYVCMNSYAMHWVSDVELLVITPKTDSLECVNGISAKQEDL